jgi:hypothetical protein
MKREVAPNIQEGRERAYEKFDKTNQRGGDGSCGWMIMSGTSVLQAERWIA